MSKNSSIGSFLERNTPDAIVNGLTLLEKLDYPINDKCGFDDQIDKLRKKAKDGEGEVLGLVAGRFAAVHFPLLSKQSAFEKYWAGFQPFPVPLPRIQLPVPPIGPTTQPPNVCEIYDDAFGRGTLAANCACRTFVEAQRQGWRELQAVTKGYFAGRRALETGVCSLDRTEEG